jgi:PKD repeat protein
MTSSEACVTIATDTSNVMIMIVNSPPVANFSYTLNNLVVNFTDSSLNGLTYNWDFGDTTYSSVTSPTHTYPGSGTFNVVLTVFNSCGIDSIVVPIIILPSGINNSLSDIINIYPNPAKDLLFISIDEIRNITGIKITVFDLIGNEIISKEFSYINHGFIEPIDLKSFSPGVYVVKVVCNNNVCFKKVVVK